MEKRYRLKDFSEAIGVDRHTITRWRKEGKLLPHVDDDGNRYYSEEQVNMYICPNHGKIIRDGNNWIDLRSIECDMGRSRYRWKEACEKKQEIPFFYNGNSGCLRLNNCKRNTLSVEINGEEGSISTGMLLGVNLGRITGAVSIAYKYAVGDHIQDGKTDITIMECCRIGSKKRRAYRYRCNKCGYDKNIISEYNITDTGCCPVCSGKKVVESINDIATTDEWMIPFFDDPELAKKYSHGSHETPGFHCPDCGRKRKELLEIRTLYSTRSIGCICGDGYSYPNKYMYSVLEQLFSQGRILEFDNEYSDEWTKRKKFDFIVELIPDGETIIIEMDGSLGHGNRSLDKNQPPEETKKIDNWKDSQAKKHGITVYRIDARESNLEYLRKSILQTLSSLIDLNEVDWEIADRFAISNFTKTVCQYYEKNKPITIKKLSQAFHISPSTANDYIQRGESYGWCSYDWELYNKNRFASSRIEHEKRQERVKEVCEYYKNHKPILASQIADHFGLHWGTIYSYLKEGEELGYEPYDKEYGKRINAQNNSRARKGLRGKKVLCFSNDGKLIKAYDSLTKAAEENGVSLAAISSCCRKKGTSAGLIFRFEDDCGFDYRKQ